MTVSGKQEMVLVQQSVIGGAALIFHNTSVNRWHAEFRDSASDTFYGRLVRLIPSSLAVTNIHVTLSHAAPAQVLQGCLLIVRCHPIVLCNIVLSIPTLALWNNDGPPRELPGAQ